MATPEQAPLQTPRQTREQQRAQRAYQQVEKHRDNRDKEREAEYKRFCKRFPALIQSCGLVQAIAFAQAKLPDYLNDLAAVMEQENQETLAQQARTAPLNQYQKYSQDALAAATWLKRYAEALLKGDKT